MKTPWQEYGVVADSWWSDELMLTSYFQRWYPVLTLIMLPRVSVDVCEAFWAVHVSKICVTGLAISWTWDSQTLNWSKNNLRGIIFVRRPIWGFDSRTLHLLLYQYGACSRNVAIWELEPKLGRVLRKRRSKNWLFLLVFKITSCHIWSVGNNKKTSLKSFETQIKADFCSR